MAKRPLVLSLHGIRTRGAWQKQLTPVLNRGGFDHAPLDFGFIRAVQLLFPPMRRRQMLWFRDQYTALAHEADGTPISVIAHSFGTYLVASSLEYFPEIRLDRIVFCGSIVRRDYPWSRIIRDARQATSVLNDFGRMDTWASLVGWLVADAGPSGSSGFSDTADGAIVQRDHRRFEHSDYFYVLNYEKNWIPFLQGAHLEPLASTIVDPPGWRFRTTALIALLSAALLSYVAIRRLGSFPSGPLPTTPESATSLPAPESPGAGTVGSPNPPLNPPEPDLTARGRSGGGTTTTAPSPEPGRGGATGAVSEISRGGGSRGGRSQTTTQPAPAWVRLDTPLTILVPAASFINGDGVALGSCGQGASVLANDNYPGGCNSRPNSAEWNVDVAEPGRFLMEVEYASVAARPVRMTLNGIRIRDQALTTATGGGDEQHQRYQDVGLVHLQMASNRLRMERGDVFPHIRNVRFTALLPSAIGASSYRLLRADVGGEIDPSTIVRVEGTDCSIAYSEYRPPGAIILHVIHSSIAADKRDRELAVNTTHKIALGSNDIVFTLRGFNGGAADVMVQVRPRQR